VPHTLNVDLWLVNSTENDRWDDNGNETDHAAGARPQIYRPVSDFSEGVPEARAALNLYGDFMLAQNEIMMHPLWLREDGYDIFTVMCHELAHVAVNRLLALKHRKSYFVNSLVHLFVNSLVHLQENMHGPTFLKALEGLALRVEAVYGPRAARRIWIELKDCKACGALEK
jgi:hypothetical protein